MNFKFKIANDLENFDFYTKMRCLTEQVNLQVIWEKYDS